MIEGTKGRGARRKLGVNPAHLSPKDFVCFWLRCNILTNDDPRSLKDKTLEKSYQTSVDKRCIGIYVGERIRFHFD